MQFSVENGIKISPTFPHYKGKSTKVAKTEQFAFAIERSGMEIKIPPIFAYICVLLSKIAPYLSYICILLSKIAHFMLWRRQSLHCDERSIKSTTLGHICFYQSKIHLKYLPNIVIYAVFIQNRHPSCEKGLMSNDESLAKIREI